MELCVGSFDGVYFALGYYSFCCFSSIVLPPSSVDTVCWPLAVISLLLCVNARSADAGNCWLSISVFFSYAELMGRGLWIVASTIGRVESGNPGQRRSLSVIFS